MRLLLLMFLAVLLTGQDEVVLHVDREGIVDPIVRLHGTAFLPLSEIKEPEAVVHTFSGGQRLRTTKLVPKPEYISCDGVTLALARNHPRARLAATTSFRGHPSTRRGATSTEAAILRRLAHAWFRGYGIDEKSLRGMKSKSIVATELRPHFGRAIIGRFEVTGPEATFYLLAVAEAGSSGYHLTLTESGRQNDEDDKGRSEPEFVDQLDIDRDGIDEVISIASGYESWDFSIWRFDGAFWRVIYSGGGGGC